MRAFRAIFIDRTRIPSKEDFPSEIGIYQFQFQSWSCLIFFGFAKGEPFAGGEKGQSPPLDNNEVLSSFQSQVAPYLAR